MPSLTPEQLLSEVEDVLRTMPPRESLGNETPENYAWLGRAQAVIQLWDPVRAVFFSGNIAKVHSGRARDFEAGVPAVLTTLHQVRHELRMQAVGPMTVAVGMGNVFDYFDEVRKVIETAKADLLFVDPYLDAEFVSRYLPHVTRGVAVRLLGRESLATLLPAAALLRQQTGLSIEVRSAGGFHDRYVFVDRQSCYHSGASFKDGAKKAPTTFSQIVDAFSAVSSMYEQAWLAATVRT